MKNKTPLNCSWQSMLHFYCFSQEMMNMISPLDSCLIFHSPKLPEWNELYGRRKFKHIIYLHVLSLQEGSTLLQESKINLKVIGPKRRLDWYVKFNAKIFQSFMVRHNPVNRSMAYYTQEIANKARKTYVHPSMHTLKQNLSFLIDQRRVRIFKNIFSDKLQTLSLQQIMSGIVSFTSVASNLEKYDHEYSQTIELEQHINDLTSNWIDISLQVISQNCTIRNPYFLNPTHQMYCKMFYDNPGHVTARLKKTGAEESITWPINVTFKDENATVNFSTSNIEHVQSTMLNRSTDVVFSSKSSKM